MDETAATAATVTAAAPLSPVPPIDLPRSDLGVGSREVPEACSPPPAERPSLRWNVRFVLIGGGGDRSGGILQLNPHPRSRWATLRDLDDDILAGRYLGPDEEIKEGTCFIVDIFEVFVGCLVQVEMSVDRPVDCVDLSPERGAAKVGGRFWALADSDDDDESTATGMVAEMVARRAMVPVVGLGQAARSDCAAPTPLRVVPKRPAAPPVRPWIGPLPQVIFRATSLIRMWSLLTPTDARERMVTGSIRWETVARAIFSRFGWRSYVLQELLQAFPALAMTTSSVNATALDTAATQGHIGIVNLLLDTDASLARIARSNGKTVLHSAARMGHVEVVASLLNKDPDIGFRTDRKGQTALHMASKGQNAEILLELLKPDVSVIHLEDNKGNRALHVATHKGNTIMVQTLISIEEIDINAVNKAGEIAFAIAEKQGNEELVNILREVGGVPAKEQVNPPKSAKQLKQTVSDIKHDVQSQIKQTRQTKMHVHKIKKRIQKLHIGGLNNAINSNTVVAVLIATVAFASIFTIPGNFLENMKEAPEPNMTLGQALVASRPAFIIFLVFDSLALLISLAVVVVQTSLIVVEQKAKQKMVFVMNKLMWLACLCISAAFIALTYVVVGRNDEWLAWCTMAIGTVIMLTTIGSMCYCIISHRMEAQSMRRIRRSSMSQSWSISVDSDTELDMTSRNKTMYAL